jgi:hypothetical protein
LESTAPGDWLETTHEPRAPTWWAGLPLSGSPSLGSLPQEDC